MSTHPDPAALLEHCPLPWRIEETQATLWIGTPKGDTKLNEIVCGISILDLKPEALALVRANSKLIVDSVNALSAAPSGCAEQDKNPFALTGEFHAWLDSLGLMCVKKDWVAPRPSPSPAGGADERRIRFILSNCEVTLRGEPIGDLEELDNHIDAATQATPAKEGK